MTAASSAGLLGLRDRTKAWRRVQIREQAMRLSVELCDEATTVRQVADAAEMTLDDALCILAIGMQGLDGGLRP